MLSFLRVRYSAAVSNRTLAEVENLREKEQNRILCLLAVAREENLKSC
jgi:hypothetical protein